MARSLLEYHEKHGDVWWTLKDPSVRWAALLVTPYMNRLNDLPGAQVTKESLVRSIAFVSPPVAATRVVVKVHRCTHLLEKAKHWIRPSKAAQEWRMARWLGESNVSTLTPLAYGERWAGGLLQECCLISESLPEVRPLIEILREPGGRTPLAMRRGLMRAAAGLIRRMHDARVVHDDLHAGNILCGQSDGKVYLMDLHAAHRVRWVRLRARLENLASFFASILPLTSEHERLEFLHEYARDDAEMGRSIPLRLAALEKRAEAYRARLRRVRTARCLQRSSEFDVQHVDGARVYFRRGFPIESIWEALRLHRTAASAGGERVLKKSARGSVTLVDVKGLQGVVSLCVKESRRYGWKDSVEALFRGSEARRIWVASQGLRVRGIPACELLAAGEHRRFGLVRQTFIIMRALENCVPLDKYIYSQTACLDGRELGRWKRNLARRLGLLLAEVHKKQVFHADLKPANIMVRERSGPDWEFVLVDLDRVRFEHPVSLRRRARNLAQLDSALQLRASPADRLRCLKAYMEASPGVNFGDIRRFVRGILAESEKRQRYYRSLIEQSLARLRPEELGRAGL